MISFVWTPGQPLPAGTGGSENYTVGHVRELNRRGIASQVVTVGLGAADGRGELDGTVVFVTDLPDVGLTSTTERSLTDTDLLGHRPDPSGSTIAIGAR